jgi:ParB family chromosome partitioning protein
MEKTKKRKKKVLGKGLGALIPDFDAVGDLSGDYFLCDIDRIQPNQYQPRKQFSDQELESLCLSIKEQGIIQPLILRKSHNDFELIAGERRLRAAKLAGLKKVPCVLKDISDVQQLEISLIENIQRENLNPIEESEAYHRLITEFHLTQEQAADRVGKSRSTVANFLRLRQLPEQIKASIIDGRLSMGHARAILGISLNTDQLAVWRKILSKDLSVREVESLTKRLKEAPKKRKRQESISDNIYYSDIADELSRIFGTKIQIKRKGKKGKVVIEFYNDRDLDRLLSLLNRS